MTKMKNKILLLFFIPCLSFAQIGINTTDPRTTLDVNGAVTHREVSFAVTSNAVNINTDTSLANLTGSATGTVTVTAFVPTINGHLLTISNNTTGGFGATFAGTTIPNAQAVAFVYTNGAWKTTITNLYNSDGTLTGYRTVALGANNLIFTGTGRTEYNAEGGLGFPGDTRRGLAKIYDIGSGNVFGMEQVTWDQVGSPSFKPALRLFTSNFSDAHLAFGKYTTATNYFEFARFTSTGDFGIGNAFPTSTFHVTGSISNSITVISGDLTLDASHKTVIIPTWGSALIVTLPAAATRDGRIYTIVNTTAGAKTIGTYVNLAGTNVTTIGAASSVEVQSDGTYWWQIR